MLNEGDDAPNVTVQTSDGTTQRLFDVVQPPLVLYFYPKDDTSGCTREAQDFTTLAGEFRKAGTGVLGVSKDTPKKHLAFIRKYDLQVGLVTDADDSVCEAYGTWVEKSMYGRKYMGIERATFLIDARGRIARIWRKVKVPGHAQDVLEAARRLE
jgi:peroxiredoxin Q/BCP